jgi:hypothetical protein
MLQPTVRWPGCFGVGHPSGAHDQIFITFIQLPLVDVGRPLWQENGSVVYNCCWSSPAQSFFGPSPNGLMTKILLSQIRESPNLEGQVPVHKSPGNKVAHFTPRHWVPFSSPLTTSRATAEVFDHLPHGVAAITKSLLDTVPWRSVGGRQQCFTNQPASTSKLHHTLHER